ncbi:MAG: AAA family ATPase [Fimbriiglobus sp.]
MLRSLELEGVGPVDGLSAEFGDRLNVLTGDNGLGKSFLLDVCFWSLTGTWPEGRTALPIPDGRKQKPSITYEIKGKSHSKKDPKSASFDFPTQTWTRPKGRPFKPGLVIYASVDGSFAVWDPARNYWRDPTTGIKEGQELPRAYQFTSKTLAEGVLTRGNLFTPPLPLFFGLIIDWERWYTKSRTEHQVPFQILEKALSILSHPSEPMTCAEPKRVFIDDPRLYPVLRMPYGDVAYPHWSAGVRRVVNFAYLLAWMWYEHLQAAELRREEPESRIILIVDEIEAHLHPKWQRTILPSLLKVVQSLRKTVEVQVFAATHSPLILASLEPHFNIDTDKLFLFDLDGPNVQFHDYPWANHGDVVGWLTSEIFGLKQARSREAEAAITAANSFMRGDLADLPDHLNSKSKIDKELQRTLAGMDPFWPRWIVETKG